MERINCLDRSNSANCLDRSDRVNCLDRSERFNYLDRPVELPSEVHCCLTLVVDVSGSMESRIDDVSDAINKMFSDMRLVPRLAKIVDVSIITFSDRDRHQLLLPFESVSSAKPVKLKTGMFTYAVKALEMAMENISRQKARYGSGCYKPWIVFVTDGRIQEDLREVSKRLKQGEIDGKHHVLCFGAGENYNPAQLLQLSDRVFKIADCNFAEFFSWIGQSMAALSASAPGDGIPVPLPEALIPLIDKN
ncbi:MAG: VWA domain-containing protein [Clostridiales bacterium]|nr:VWA domain-containing protein [Clostridiales bacterium]